VIEPIPQADEADVAEQARPIDDDITERDTLPAALGAAAALADRGFWPIWQSNSTATQRSFIDDMASLNGPYRPYW
jgi:hypothetical protein